MLAGGFFSPGKILKKACEDFSDTAVFFVFGRKGGSSRLGFCFANGLSTLREGRIEIVDCRSAGLSGFGAGSGSERWRDKARFDAGCGAVV